MTTNVTIFNAAVAGFLGGAADGRFNQDAVGADYNAIVASAGAFAAAVDGAIGASSTTAKEANLCQAICQGAISGRFANLTPSAVQATWNGIAAAIAAEFTVAKAILQ